MAGKVSVAEAIDRQEALAIGEVPFLVSRRDLEQFFERHPTGALVARRGTLEEQRQTDAVRLSERRVYACPFARLFHPGGRASSTPATSSRSPTVFAYGSISIHTGT